MEKNQIQLFQSSDGHIPLEVSSLPNNPFYFIRHGETDWNRNHIIMGQQDIALNEKGITQAANTKHLLQNITFDRVFTSPLIRAHKTAQILFEDTDTILTIDDGLMERNWGELEGAPYHQSLSALKDSELPKKAETWDAFETRVMNTLRNILTNTTHPPLIVAHAGIFVALVKNLGAPGLRAMNCSPYFFRPPERDSQPWFICNIGNNSYDED